MIQFLYTGFYDDSETPLTQGSMGPRDPAERIKPTTAESPLVSDRFGFGRPCSGFGLITVTGMRTVPGVRMYGTCEGVRDLVRDFEDNIISFRQFRQFCTGGIPKVEIVANSINGSTFAISAHIEEHIKVSNSPAQFTSSLRC